MVKNIVDGIYLNEIDLPKNPLKYLNSYIITAADKTLIIDTGFNNPQCIESFFSGINALDIDLNKTDILVTHLHSDHCGMIAELQRKGANIMFGEVEADAIINTHSKEHWESFKWRAKIFDLEKFSVDVTDHPGYKYRPEPIEKYQLLKDGEILKYGKYSFQVMLVPGHTKGHIALYEPEYKLFFCGDLILDKITPTITFWDFEQDILQVYLDTLSKVSDLQINLLLTGHRAILQDHKKRISELFEHHDRRLEEIMQILANGPHTVADVAAKMTWDITAKSWEDFPKAQKWFATSEAMAHLEHLFCQKRIQRNTKNDVFLYQI